MYRSLSGFYTNVRNFDPMAGKRPCGPKSQVMSINIHAYSHGHLSGTLYRMYIEILLGEHFCPMYTCIEDNNNNYYDDDDDWPLPH